ncbi:hypothetical protein NADFUDRAFT_82700 [Nadsonia fulvescens var. elongata DSM 6958]|uniref:UBX domain-containing protein n=1 Tax=Nadsonia fulvescens var. elongata DSM 6958 TaxID=857566 RepID=A0A1E3PLK9_9ASCO|nr:hypothetical protein NADFUDRAFT_82700 [Nadsonia fulvescens var. elongata DSM 6958]
MGFSTLRTDSALKNTSGSLEDAITWLDNHDGTSDVEEDEFTSASENTPNEQESPRTPLTEEEKNQKLEQLKAKAAIRKAQAAKVDAEERKRNEIIRRKNDQEVAKAKEELEHKLAIKAAEKKRQEIIADKKAKERIRTLIEEDKKARQLKRDQEKAAREGTEIPQAESSSPAKRATPPPSSSNRASTATESRLQFRIVGKSPIIKKYAVETTLATVASELASELNVHPSLIVFTTTFPTKRYEDTDMQQSLREAGLINAAVMVSTK